MNLEYELIRVKVRKGEQKAADHLARNPNGKVPVLIDDEIGSRFVIDLATRSVRQSAAAAR